MPISPYSGQIYSGYSIGRPYTGASTTSSYSTATSPSGYKLSSSTSSSALRGKPLPKSSFLTGNTAALKKTFSDAGLAGLSGEASISFHDNASSLRRYNGIPLQNTENKRTYNAINTDRGYGAIKRTNLLDIKEDNRRPKYESKPYVSKYGTYFHPKEESSNIKPKEIDASKINVSSQYPSFSNTSGGDIKRGEKENDSISRNRQVVRLTIKREKDKKPLVLPENSVKTIAQKLFEKYTVPESRRDSTIPSYLRTKQPTSVTSPNSETTKIVDKPPKLPTSKVSAPRDNLKASFKNDDDGNEGDDECSGDESGNMENGKDAAAKCFIRATRAATSKRELEYPEEVKDAIVAAILHPGVDIESDEEIKQLVETDFTEESEGSIKKKRKSKDIKKPDTKPLDKRKYSGTEMGGDLIVDKLKRFVKHQVSIKKESLKNNSRKSSLDKEIDIPISNVATNSNIHKHRERIIPIILQDENSFDFSQYEDKEENKMKMQDNLIPINNKNSFDKSPSKMSLHLNEPNDAPKEEGEKVTKSFDPVYQSTSVESSKTLPESFQASPHVSGEHSITHPENKVPGTSFFITDSVSDWMRRSEKDSPFWSLDAPGMKMKEEKEMGEAKEKSRKEGALKDTIKNKELIINDYESKLEKRQAKNRDEFQSELDNPIKGESSNLMKKEEEAIFDPEETELNYCLSKEGTRKEFQEAKIESGKKYLEKPSTITHFEDDPKELKGGAVESCVTDIKDKRENTPERKFDKEEEIRAYNGEEKHYILVKGMSINSDYKVTQNKNEAKEDIYKNNPEEIKLKVDLNLDESSVPKQVLAKSKRTFLKSLTAVQIQEPNLCKDSETKSFDLKKSATTQIVAERQPAFPIKRTSIDAESSTSLGIPDLEMKPSLKKFLEFAKFDLKEETEKDASDRIEINTNKEDILSPELKDVNSQVESAPEKLSLSTSKSNLLKDESQNVNNKPQKKSKPFFLTCAEEKSTAKDIINARNILKRPSKTKDSPLTDVVAPLDVKPKRVWKKPLPPKATKQSAQELTKSFNNLKKPPNVKTIATDKEPESDLKEIDKQTKNSEEVDRKSLSRNQNNVMQTKDEMESSKLESTYKNEDHKFSTKDERNDSEEIIKNSEGLYKKPSQTEEETRELNSGEKSEARPSQSKALRDPSVPGASSVANGDSEEKCSLSTSQSADSAYGSSPSTPQPRLGNFRAEKGIREEKSEPLQSKDEEVEEKDKNSEVVEEICELCGTNCHKKCEKQMANLCGVNQKLLAEALSSVKKGSSSDGKDAFRILPTASASAYKSASSVSSAEGDSTTTTTTEDEETETDTDSSEYNGPAEIRSPIQTRPKYRKYNIEDFNFIKVLGKGSFGKVMLGQQANTENYFAVKCLKKDVVLEDNDVECCLIERKVLTLGTKHPYLCHLFCSFQTPSHLFFVMEYLTGGDLMFHIQRVGRFDEYRACFYAAEIISGLKFLHNKGIIYRDLKLDNILLDFEGHIRIADFGMCKLQIYLDRFADTFCGTPDYMAPEVIKGLHYNQCVDWWSFGVLLYEMMIGKSPFKGCDEDHLFWLICNEEPFYPRFLSREAQSLLKQLLDKDATRRIGPPYSPHGEIKCHQFFKYVDWNKIERKEVETPYKPRLRHILDVQYFDRSFTKRNAAITPLDDSILESMDQTPFKEFSYTNPNITD